MEKNALMTAPLGSPGTRLITEDPCSSSVLVVGHGNGRYRLLHGQGQLLCCMQLLLIPVRFQRSTDVCEQGSMVIAPA